jgi:hypothetical protein
VGTAFATIDPGFTGVPTFAGFLWVAIVSVLPPTLRRSGTDGGPFAVPAGDQRPFVDSPGAAAPTTTKGAS